MSRLVFYVWMLPLAWTTIAWLNFHYPGDEYGGFFFGSAEGVWVLMLVPQIHSGNAPAGILPYVLVAGAATTALAGWGLDRLGCRRSPWLAALWLTLAAALVAWGLSRFPSLDRALGKNGSLLAYLLPSLNLSLTFLASAALTTLAAWRVSSRALGRGSKHAAATDESAT